MSERERLREAEDTTKHWRRWGPYLSQRQWATVREDYSADGCAWEYFSHDHARSRAYRWGEDGLLGISDDLQRLCLSMTLWNERDPILKERAFGLTSQQGNHGEDVKEYYFYLDNVPTHSYMRAQYKYPQAAFPYELLITENARRTRLDPEYELIQTGVFDHNAYFDVDIRYAKIQPDDIVLEVDLTNRSDQPAVLHFLPTLCFRNTWSWKEQQKKPRLHDVCTAQQTVIQADHDSLGTFWLYAQNGGTCIYTENETNRQRLYGIPNTSRYVKDAFHDRVVQGDVHAVNPEGFGTKAAVWYKISLSGKESRKFKLRLSNQAQLKNPFDTACLNMLKTRKAEADSFYDELQPTNMAEDDRRIQRQALAGLLWSKQYYHYVIRDWLRGDPLQPTPPASRLTGRNHEWFQLNCEDVISMPDDWEYPWFASWDLAFHMISFALIDPSFAKQQMLLLTRAWYMHPDGALPAYEWNFGAANPPVHAWAALRVFRIDRKTNNKADYDFLEQTFQKLLMNFTWWANRKDAKGNEIFQGGFLGLDNISIFNRNDNLPDGEYVNQSDGTSWMAFYCLNMLAIAIELSLNDPSYQDVAIKFFEHFIYIAEAMNANVAEGGLWNVVDHFYQDLIMFSDGKKIPIRVQSMVGLIPLLAVAVLESSTLDKLPVFKARMDWFIEHYPDLTSQTVSLCTRGTADRRLFSLVDEARLRAILRTMLEEKGFLSPYGIRSVSRYHLEHPFRLEINNRHYSVNYEPAESTVPLFGGNSNWRGPVWFPINYLLIEALQGFHYYYGDSFLVECPTGSGRQSTLWDVAMELAERLINIFRQDPGGRRPVFGGELLFQNDPDWHNNLLFHEYFHGDNGAGLGASHQTGWTALVAKLIQQTTEYKNVKQPDRV